MRGHFLIQNYWGNPKNKYIERDLACLATHLHHWGCRIAICLPTGLGGRGSHWFLLCLQPRTISSEDDKDILRPEMSSSTTTSLGTKKNWVNSLFRFFWLFSSFGLVVFVDIRNKKQQREKGEAPSYVLLSKNLSFLSFLHSPSFSFAKINKFFVKNDSFKF